MSESDNPNSGQFDQPYTWSRKLVPVITYQNQRGIAVAVIDQVTKSESTPKKIIDSITQFNQGAVDLPHRYSFTLRIRQNCDAWEALAWLMYNDRYFHLDIAEEEGGGNENQPEQAKWLPILELLKFCKVEGHSDTIVTDDIPVSVFRCIALRRGMASIGQGKLFGAGVHFSDDDVPAEYDSNQIIPES